MSARADVPPNWYHVRTVVEDFDRHLALEYARAVRNAARAAARESDARPPTAPPIPIPAADRRPLSHSLTCPCQRCHA